MTRDSDRQQRDFLAGVYLMGFALIVLMVAGSAIVGAVVLFAQ